MTVRSLIKGTAERILLWSGAARMHRRTMSDQVLILAYHNIIPDGTDHVGDTANHLPLSSFAAQLEALRSTHDVIPLAEVFTAKRGASRRPRAAITFDDAYRGAVIHGLPEVLRQGLPATMFTAPAFLGGHPFWWDSLADRERGGLDPSLRDHVLGELRGEDAPIRAWAQRTGVRVGDVPDVARCATESELLAAAARPGITLGSHTWSHPNLARLEPRELIAEMEKPLAWLRERVEAPLPWIAYPYGFFNDAVKRATAAAGYEAGLAISGGWVRPDSSDRLAVPRLNIPPGLSQRGFVLRGAGLLGG